MYYVHVLFSKIFFTVYPSLCLSFIFIYQWHLKQILKQNKYKAHWGKAALPQIQVSGLFKNNNLVKNDTCSFMVYIKTKQSVLIFVKTVMYVMNAWLFDLNPYDCPNRTIQWDWGLRQQPASCV